MVKFVNDSRGMKIAKSGNCSYFVGGEKGSWFVGLIVIGDSVQRDGLQQHDLPSLEAAKALVAKHSYMVALADEDLKQVAIGSVLLEEVEENRVRIRRMSDPELTYCKSMTLADAASALKAGIQL